MTRDPENEPTGETPEEKADRLAAYDLNGDGKFSLTEDTRARLGIIDAELQETAEEGGITGKLADAAHKIVDRLDND